MNDVAITPEQAKAARALLAWSQQELANEARVATSTVADFERGSRTPVANNAQAIRAAFEARGLKFVAGGVVEKAMLPSPTAQLKPGNLVRWIGATHLAQWGESRDGQSSIPELIRRLIYSGLGSSAQVSFPSDESVQYAGYDGTCTALLESSYVPLGRSVWEFGTQKSKIRKKADDDYEKRKANPLGEDPGSTTFVFVTPQRFSGKADWLAEKRAQGFWQNVEVIDADDLVHWLELHPGVAQWLAIRIGRRPNGLRNLEEAWSEWTKATRTPISEDVLLTDRDGDATSVLKWLKNPVQVLDIQGESPDEVIAFIYASLSALPEANRLSYLNRCIIVENRATARQLLGLGMPLILILMEPEPGLSQQLADEGHHVLSVGSAESIFVSRRLARPWTYNLQSALERAGLKEEDAYQYSRACGRSLTVLRRLLPAFPQARPKWAVSATNELISAMLAGAWDSSFNEDKRLLSTLANCRYEDFEERLAQYTTGIDAPLIRVGSAWKVVSLRDLWTLIGGQVVESQILRYRKVFDRVFTSINPRFDIIRDENYIEHVGRFDDEPSEVLRRGLQETLLALGVYPNVATLIPQREFIAEQIVRELFAQADHKLWWSLSRDFGRLAEAAPQAFLDALELGLEGTLPPIMELFRSDPGFMHSTEYLAHLLWALEMLARSPEYISRAAQLLAHLDEIDPGGRWGNRPSASLRRIFLSWSPQTYATQENRLKVIDRILKLYPLAGWNLLVALAPKFHDTSSPSSKPEWRDFAPIEPEVTSYQSVAKAGREIGRRLLQHVGNDNERWKTILDHWGNFDSQWRKNAAQQLSDHLRDQTDAASIEAIREQIRGILQKHRNFSKADWALGEPELASLDEIFQELTPETVQEKHRWLFNPMPGGFRPDLSWADQMQELQVARSAVAEELLTVLSRADLFEFINTITFRAELGGCIAKSSVPLEVKDDLLKEAITSADQNIVQMGMGLLWGLRELRGDDWLNDLWAKAIEESWGIEAEFCVIVAIPKTRQLWDQISNRSADLEEKYWIRMDSYRIPDDADEKYVVGKLIEFKRARIAVGWLGNITDKRPQGELDSGVVLSALDAAAGEQAPNDSNDATMFTYYLGLILDRLEREESVTEQQLVKIEWVYFQALRYSSRPTRTLHKALAKDPAFFVDMLKMVYLPAKDSGIEEEPKGTLNQVEAMAHQAWDVMHHWKIVPGTKESGEIDPLGLEDWVKTARKLLSESGRGDIGDQKIGEILSAAPRGKDEIWPAEPVREVIELVRSKHLETGFELGVFNGRGVTVRAPLDGGDQERSLANTYRSDANAMRFDWPRTAACLERIAERYEYDARHQDDSAEQRDWY